jgi:hypothetical protein
VAAADDARLAGGLAAYSLHLLHHTHLPRRCTSLTALDSVNEKITVPSFVIACRGMYCGMTDGAAFAVHCTLYLCCGRWNGRYLIWSCGGDLVTEYLGNIVAFSRGIA